MGMAAVKKTESYTYSYLIINNLFVQQRIINNKFYICLDNVYMIGFTGNLNFKWSIDEHTKKYYKN